MAELRIAPFIMRAETWEAVQTAMAVQGSIYSGEQLRGRLNNIVADFRKIKKNHVISAEEKERRLAPMILLNIFCAGRGEGGGGGGSGVIL